MKNQEKGYTWRVGLSCLGIHWHPVTGWYMGDGLVPIERWESSQSYKKWEWWK